MSVSTKFQTGTFCWVDLGTTEPDAAKKFYRELFGWANFDAPSPDGVYTMFTLDEQPVSAVYQKNPQQPQPAWCCYVAVDDLEKYVDKVKAAGGQVFMTHDIPDAGRMAVCADSTGGHFALWQATKHPGGRTMDVGCMCWHELMSNDTVKSQKFYTEVFGWTAETKDMGMPYTVLSSGDKQVGGMMAITPEMGQMPTNWLVYFTVNDTDNSIGKALQQGGHKCMGPMDVPTVGRIAVLTDPQGAAFGVVAFPQ